MLFLRGVGGGGTAAAVGGALVRHFSDYNAVDLRRIYTNVPRVDPSLVSDSLYQIVKKHGPLSVANTWNHVKDANIDGLNSKTQMKIVLKWMMGKKMLKLSCTGVGSAKKFHYSILPEDRRARNASLPSPASDTSKSSDKEIKQTAKKGEKDK